MVKKKNFGIRAKTRIFLKENMGKFSLLDLVIFSMIQHQKHGQQRKNRYIWILSNFKTMVHQDTIKRVKRQFCGFKEWEKISANYLFEERLIYRTHE